MQRTPRTVLCTLAGIVLASPAGQALGRPWTYVGSSPYAGPAIAALQDFDRIKMYDAIVDNQGNVYVTAGDGENNTAGVPGGVSIFNPDGSGGWNRVDVNLSPAGLNIPGGITKFMLGPDGKVYALQNWSEMGGNSTWMYNRGWDHKILRIDPTGAVTVIVNATTSCGPVCPGAEVVIADATFGPDGNIYWVMKTASDAQCFKNHWFWRYNFTNGQVEQHPVGNGVNNGWLDKLPFFTLLSVGDGWFFTWTAQETNKSLKSATAISWATNRVIAENEKINPGWAATKGSTAMAYDPVRKKVWIVPHGENSAFGAALIMSRWNGTPANSGLYTGNMVDVNPDPLIEDMRMEGIEPGTCLNNQDNWHANGNDPMAQEDNGGLYWATCMKIDPYDGKAWMSWGSQAGYNYAGTYGPVGPIYTVEPDGCGPSGNEGNPQAAHPEYGTNASETVGLAFGKNAAGEDKVYALTIDLVRREFNLFEADAGSPPTGACCTSLGCVITTVDRCVGEYQGDGVICENVDCSCRACHKPFADGDGDGDVDQADFAILQMCISGPDGVVADAPCKCSCYDRDGANGVDAADITLWIKCASGPGIAADPDCETAP